MAVRLKPTSVFVNPTTTPLFSALTVGAMESVSVQVENLDGTQTFNGTVRSRLDPSNAMADSTIPDLQGIGPGGTVVVTLMLPATAEFDVVGTMGGAGGLVRVTVISRMGGQTLSMGRSR